MEVWCEDFLELRVWIYVGVGCVCMMYGLSLREECYVRDSCLSCQWSVLKELDSVMGDAEQEA